MIVYFFMLTACKEFIGLMLCLESERRADINRLRSHKWFLMDYNGVSEEIVPYSIGMKSYQLFIKIPLYILLPTLYYTTNFILIAFVLINGF